MYSAEHLQKHFEQELQSRISGLKRKGPDSLYLPVHYVLEDGGKRIRPLLLLLGYNMFSDEIEKALPAALAIEIFHNFTLLHDDIMDNAEVRRNRQTVHLKFGENSAILSGDVMSFLSYSYLFENESMLSLKVARVFTQTAIEVCEGQQLDMDFETRSEVLEEEYLEMIRLKTAVLLACSLKAGALLANADNSVAENLYQYGICLGMAFQLQDDLLDTFGNQETFGKKIGGDIIANKKTFLLINALKNCDKSQLDILVSWLNSTHSNPENKIREVTEIYNQTGVKRITELKIESYFAEMDKIMKNIPVDEEKKTELKMIASKMLKRIS
jgi:geranylgeranyl diphosphate synthase type II